MSSALGLTRRSGWNNTELGLDGTYLVRECGLGGTGRTKGWPANDVSSSPPHPRASTCPSRQQATTILHLHSLLPTTPSPQTPKENDHNHNHNHLSLHPNPPILFPPLLHPPTNYHNPLLPTLLLVHTHPILLPTPPHLQPNPHRRPQHPIIPQRRSKPALKPARRKSNNSIHG